MAETELQGPAEFEPSGQDSVLSSRLSALLREIARLPGAETGSAWESALRPGAVIGRFELLREIGRGGFGIVYEARDRELGRTVAFKAVRVGEDAGELGGRLLREAEASARLCHPNIVTLFDVGRSEHGPYLILEYLRGETLNRRLARGPLPVAEALRVAAEVAKGVAHAHSQGIVHRDLTPGNIFLCEDGQVKVLDLGMAHAFGRRRLEGGTPGYMAPEQRRGAPEDERTDVFALGVILYKILANDLPFPRFANYDRDPPALEISGAPALGPLVARMLDRDPVKRPRDAGEVAEALGAFQRELERTPSGAGAVTARTRRFSRVRTAAYGAVVAVAVALAAAALWQRLRRPSEAPAPPDASSLSIAVLAFADLSPAKDHEYFSDGLAEEILNALARVKGLRVPSRTSSFFFKGKSATLAEIGRELRVSAVLEGSVRKDGNRLRVTAQLVNVSDGFTQWRDVYEGGLSDLFAFQEEIAHSVVIALDARRSGANPSAAAPPAAAAADAAVPDAGTTDAGMADAGAAASGNALATRDPEVYRQYLLGRYYDRRLTSQGLRQAVEAYERALALDPRYAPAWAELAMDLYVLADRTDSNEALKAQHQRALAAAERAVALAPDLSSGLSARGLLRAIMAHDWPGAMADFERALTVNGNDADAHRRYATLLAGSGRLDEAIREARKAVDLDPLGVSWWKLGQFYQWAGELELAEAAIRKDLKVQPGGESALITLGKNLLLQSNPREALAVFERCAEEDHRLWGRATAAFSLKDEAGSREALRKLIANYGHTSAYNIAEAYAWRQDKGAALDWLERAYLQGEGALAGLLKSDPFLRNVRGDPRYAALLRKLRLPSDP